MVANIMHAAEGSMVNNQAYSTLPYKSVAVALMFAVILGPVGLLYGSFWGGFFMILLGFVVISSKLFVPILLLWILCCIWGVRAVESYNRKVFQGQLQHAKTNSTS